MTNKLQKAYREGRRAMTIVELAKKYLKRKSFTAMIEAKTNLKLVKPKDELPSPDFSKVDYTIKENPAFGNDGYILEAYISVNKEWLKKNKMGALIKALHDEGIEADLGMWLGQPYVQSDSKQRAKGGMVSIKIFWDLKNNLEAYALGADLGIWKTATAVKSKEQYDARKKWATEKVKKANAYKKKAIEMLNHRKLETKEERDRVWKEEYLPTLSKMIEEMKAKGAHWHKLSDEVK